MVTLSGKIKQKGEIGTIAQTSIGRMGGVGVTFVNKDGGAKYVITTCG